MTTKISVESLIKEAYEDSYELGVEKGEFVGQFLKSDNLPVGTELTVQDFENSVAHDNGGYIQLHIPKGTMETSDNSECLDVIEILTDMNYRIAHSLVKRRKSSKTFTVTDEYDGDMPIYLKGLKYGLAKVGIFELSMIERLETYVLTFSNKSFTVSKRRLVLGRGYEYSELYKKYTGNPKLLENQKIFNDEKKYNDMKNNHLFKPENSDIVTNKPPRAIIRFILESTVIGDLQKEEIEARTMGKLIGRDCKVINDDNNESDGKEKYMIFDYRLDKETGKPKEVIRPYLTEAFAFRFDHAKSILGHDLNRYRSFIPAKRITFEIMERRCKPIYNFGVPKHRIECYDEKDGKCYAVGYYTNIDGDSSMMTIEERPKQETKDIVGETTYVNVKTGKAETHSIQKKTKEEEPSKKPVKKATTSKTKTEVKKQSSTSKKK